MAETADRFATIMDALTADAMTGNERFAAVAALDELKAEQAALEAQLTEALDLLDRRKGE